MLDWDLNSNSANNFNISYAIINLWEQISQIFNLQIWIWTIDGFEFVCRIFSYQD
jgi:hypothetical protein